MVTTSGQPVVLCEGLTIEEEAAFLEMVNDAVASGDLSAEDAIEIIDREYDILLAAK